MDRERVVMTNLTQAIEFCLKAIKTHAEYRQTKVFTFADGHSLSKIYKSLPEDLQLELHSESIKFAEDYAAFAKAVKDKTSQLMAGFGPLNAAPGPDVAAWKNIAEGIGRSTYTALVGVNDPASVSAVGCKPDEWLDRALMDIGEITYHRYSPFESRDEYGVIPIHLGLMLGRFMYEYLFPVTAAGRV